MAGRRALAHRSLAVPIPLEPAAGSLEPPGVVAGVTHGPAVRAVARPRRSRVTFSTDSYRGWPRDASGLHPSGTIASLGTIATPSRTVNDVLSAIASHP